MSALMEVQDFAELMVVERFNDMNDNEFERYVRSQNSPQTKARAKEAKSYTVEQTCSSRIVHTKSQTRQR